VRIVLETGEGRRGFRVHADDGGGYFETTTSPERAISEVRDRLLRFVAADLAVRRDGCVRHVRVFRGACPTCGLPASDCVGVDL